MRNWRRRARPSARPRKPRAPPSARLTALPKRNALDELLRRWQLHDGHLEQQVKGDRLLGRAAKSRGGGR